MKRMLCLILSFLMILPTFSLTILADGPVLITESSPDYKESIGFGGYIVRTKSDGSIMLSPFLNQLKTMIDNGENIADYTAVMTFTLLSGKNGEAVHTFDTVHAALNTSNGTYFDIYLNGSKGTTGFCPTASKFYDIELKIYKNYQKSNEECALYGTYKSAQIPSTISSSKYYKPTSAPVNCEISLSYSFNNELKGSAAGKVFITSNGAGSFELLWGDAEGKPLTVKAGTKELKYSELASFSFENENGGTYTQNILGFTAIPVGAKKIIVADASGKVLNSLDIPAAKLLDQKDPNYSFGVVSDVHFNYFFDDTKKTDYAENAFDTALKFYKDVDVKLVAAAGDYSLYGEEESYREFNAAVAKSGLLVIACGGNHELYAKLDVMYGKNGYWRKYMNTGIYDKSVEGVLDIADNGIDFTYQLPDDKDSVFISLSQWYWDGHSAAQEKLVEPEQLEWLEEQFELHKDKTVYLLFHTYLSDDDRENIDGQGDLKSDGGYSYNGHYNQYTKDEVKFRELLTKYDNVIWYNGHSHYEYSMQKYNENLNIYNYQGTTATMIHVPSVTNPRTVAPGATHYSSLAGDASQGALQFVYDEYQIMNGVDLWSEEILSYACYIIYTDEEFKEEFVIKEGTANNGDITWTYNEQLNTLRFEGKGDITNDLPGWEKYKEVVKTLYIGPGITSIGENTFAGFKNLEVAEIKEGVTVIKEGAFKNTAIKKLILPESLTRVEKDAFSGVEKISYVSFFGSAETWENVFIGAGNESIKDNIKFEKVKITFVAGDVTQTVDVKYGTSPTYDGLPSKYHEDEKKHYPFTAWSDGTNKYKPTQDLPVATKNKTYTAIFGKEVDRFVSGKIQNGVIKWNLDRKTATLTISGGGIIPALDDYNDQAWREYASEIRNVVVKSGIKTIGKNTLCKLPALRSVYIEEGITMLQMDCLAYNDLLTEIYLPSTLTTVGQGTVYESNNIKTIYYYGTEAQWKSFCTSITTMYNTNITGAENLIYLTHCEGEHTPGEWSYDNGTHHYVCKDCMVVSQPEKHTLGDWTTTIAPTTTSEGEKARVCVCGYKQTEVIPQLTETVVPDSATPVTTTPPETTAPKNDITVYIIIGISALVIIGGAVAAVVVIKKKKK